MYGGFGFSMPKDSDECEPAKPLYRYVKLGTSNKQLAILEVKTGCPIQYIVRQGSPEEIAKHADRVLASWELYFEAIVRKKAA